MDEVREKSQAFLTVTFKDKGGTATNPTSPKYRIDDLLTGDSIKALTALSPSSGVVEITIEASENAMVDATLDFEVHRVTVTSDQVNEEFRFRVRNLKKVS